MSSAAKPIALETVNALFSKIIGPFSATMIAPHLVEPANIEERVGALVNEFSAHPEFLAPFRKLLASLQNKEVVASLEEQIRFFQSSQTRNYLFVNLLNKVLDVKELKLDLETGRLPSKPNELLKFSYTARVEFGEESRYKDLMGAIGLLFDFVFYLQKSALLELNGTKFDDFIDASFKKGVEEGKLVTRLSRHKDKLTNEKFAPVIPILRQLSHVILCLLYPTIAPEFYKQLAGRKYTEPMKLALEAKEFGIHSAMIASYVAQSFEIFGPLGEAMSVWGTPHVAHYTKSKGIHDILGIAELATLLKESYRLGDFPESAKVGTIIPELKFFDFTLSSKARADFEEKQE